MDSQADNVDGKKDFVNIQTESCKIFSLVYRGVLTIYHNQYPILHILWRW